MKRNIYSLVLTIAACLMLNGAHAQCGSLYSDLLYSNVTVETDTYSTVYGQAMDIYQPVGDNSTARPLFIMAHGGSFYEGDKSEGDIVALCTVFAMRGYVCASINYRLTSEANLADSALLIGAVFQAVSDAKAAVRYFTKDAATTNKFRIDPNVVVIGGTSAGAVLAVQYAYLNGANLSANHVAPYIVAAIDSNGGIEGNSGNAGYPDSVIAVMSLAGGINNPAWIVPGEPAMVMCQGTADSVVPYGCNEIYRVPGLDSYQLIRLCGSGAMQPVLEEAGIKNALLPFPGDGHVPWATDDTLLIQLDTFVANFLAPIVCTQMLATGISDLNPTAALSVYPNPASTVVTVKGGTGIQSLKLLDQLGRTVWADDKVNALQTEVPVGVLAPGIYYLLATFSNSEQVVRKIVKQ